MLLALMETYQARYDLVPELAAQAPQPRQQTRRRDKFRLTHSLARFAPAGGAVAEPASTVESASTAD